MYFSFQASMSERNDVSSLLTPQKRGHAMVAFTRRSVSSVSIGCTAKNRHVEKTCQRLAEFNETTKARERTLLLLARVHLLFNQLLETLIENIGLVGHARQQLSEDSFVAGRLIGLLFKQCLQLSVKEVGLIGDAFSDFSLQLDRLNTVAEENS